MPSNTLTNQSKTGGDTGEKRLERVKAQRDRSEDAESRVAKALKAVASIGVKYDNIDAETWKMIAQDPNLEGL